MIKTFADKRTEQIAQGQQPKRLATEIYERARKRLVQIDNAVSLDDLRLPPSNRLEKLTGNRSGQYSIRVNIQWRICFVFEGGDFFNVEFTDYH